MIAEDVSGIFCEIWSDVKKEKTIKNQERIQTEHLFKIKEDQEEIERRKKMATVKELLKVAQSNFTKMVRNPRIGKFLDDKFQKQISETDSSFTPYFRYILGNHYFPSHIAITRQLELVMNWLSTDMELNDAIRVLTALGDSRRLFVEFLLKDWEENAKFVGKNNGTNFKGF